MNYFELFEIPVTPKVDSHIITKKYFELQRKNHPDFFSDATEAEKESFIQLSANINKAYTTFKDDQKTLEYFLTLNGIIEQDEKYNLPNDFLMEMMDFNEELLDIGKETAINKVKEYEMLLLNDIKDSIENFDQQASEEVIIKMKAYYYKKKYLNRILDRLED